MKIFHLYACSCEYAYPQYLDKNLPEDAFDTEIMCNTDLEVRYLKGLHELGEDCTLLYPRRFNLPIKEFKHRAGYKIVRFPISMFEGNTGKEYIFQMWDYIKKEKPDLIHYHGIYGGAKFHYFRFFVLTAWFCKRNRIPLFGWYHVGSFPEHKRFPFLKNLYCINTKTLLSCRGITSINHLELERLFNPQASDYYGIDFSKLPHQLTPNTIDRKLFFPIDKQEARQKLSLSTDKKYILMVARLFPEKGLHHLLNILPQILENHPSTNLLIVGDFLENESTYKQQILNLIHEKHLENSVHFMGRVEHQNGLNYYYNAADVFVLPTLKETFGGVNLEALACGVPVVSTDCGEIPYYLHQELGFVVRKGNEPELLEAIDKVLSLKFKLNLEILETTLQTYDYLESAKSLLNFYKEHLKQ